MRTLTLHARMVTPCTRRSETHSHIHTDVQSGKRASTYMQSASNRTSCIITFFQRRTLTRKIDIFFPLKHPIGHLIFIPKCPSLSNESVRLQLSRPATQRQITTRHFFPSEVWSCSCCEYTTLCIDNIFFYFWTLMPSSMWYKEGHVFIPLLGDVFHFSSKIFPKKTWILLVCTQLLQTLALKYNLWMGKTRIILLCWVVYAFFFFCLIEEPWYIHGDKWCTAWIPPYCTISLYHDPRPACSVLWFHCVLVGLFVYRWILLPCHSFIKVCTSSQGDEKQRQRSFFCITTNSLWKNDYLL